ncbi:OmpA family protein [Pantoea brenneri]|jgi:flagellar motor protein MotB|uniref:OmpA family protein n=1 Tax=Pantoea brenneri TaxID=472694 RepID=UPI001681BCE9|nr:OmpA family protein [Pantoea brenneri]MDH1087615.1 OmpA family protein [Pantoea brenneri]QNU43008.1 OmpA family protein [Mixta calida]
MRANASRKRSHEEEEESVFVSMTDMTVSFLFIVMVLLAFFASRYNDKNTVPRDEYEQAVQTRDKTIEDLRAEIALLKQVDPLEQYMSQAAAARLNLLYQLRNNLKQSFPELPVDVIPEEGTLRFQGEGLFTSNSYTLSEDKRKIVEALAKTLDSLLPCYTFSQNVGWNKSCNPSFAIIEAVQIEGHTDSKGEDVYNLNLSTNRAITTFTSMLAAAPDLVAHFNMRNQPVLSVAGYGKMRPVKPNDTPQNMAMNRRIDLRIIMHTPANAAEIDDIRKRLIEPLKKSVL